MYDLAALVPWLIREIGKFRGAKPQAPMAEYMAVLESVRVLNWPCTGREGDDTLPSLLDHSMGSFEFSDVEGACWYWPAHDAVKVCTDLLSPMGSCFWVSLLPCMHM